MHGTQNHSPHPLHAPGSVRNFSTTGVGSKLGGDCVSSGTTYSAYHMSASSPAVTCSSTSPFATGTTMEPATAAVALASRRVPPTVAGLSPALTCAPVMVGGTVAAPASGCATKNTLPGSSIFTASVNSKSSTDVTLGYPWLNVGAKVSGVWQRRHKRTTHTHTHTHTYTTRRRAWSVLVSRAPGEHKPRVRARTIGCCDGDGSEHRGLPVALGVDSDHIPALRTNTHTSTCHPRSRVTYHARQAHNTGHVQSATQTTTKTQTSNPILNPKPNVHVIRPLCNQQRITALLSRRQRQGHRPCACRSSITEAAPQPHLCRVRRRRSTGHDDEGERAAFVEGHRQRHTRVSDLADGGIRGKLGRGYVCRPDNKPRRVKTTNIGLVMRGGEGGQR